jgi:hypothetical protein
LSQVASAEHVQAFIQDIEGRYGVCCHEPSDRRSFS